jgi:hypothetical protein
MKICDKHARMELPPGAVAVFEILGHEIPSEWGFKRAAETDRYSSSAARDCRRISKPEQALTGERLFCFDFL